MTLVITKPPELQKSLATAAAAAAAAAATITTTITMTKISKFTPFAFSYSIAPYDQAIFAPYQSNKTVSPIAL